MQIELQGLELLLERWQQRPMAPAREISPFSSDARRAAPFSETEIAELKAYLAQQAPSHFARLFPYEVLPATSAAKPGDAAT
jgi:hypothetical protein